jgi:phage-related protein
MPVRFEGDSPKRPRSFSKHVRYDLGFQPYLLQVVRQPTDFKSTPSVGPGVE